MKNIDFFSCHNREGKVADSMRQNTSDFKSIYLPGKYFTFTRAHEAWKSHIIFIEDLSIISNAWIKVKKYLFLKRIFVVSYIFNV